MGQLSRDGQLRRPYWGQQEIIAWAEQNGIEVTSDGSFALASGAGCISMTVLASSLMSGSRIRG
jgi:hypothetical protein